MSAAAAPAIAVPSTAASAVSAAGAAAAAAPAIAAPACALSAAALAIPVPPLDPAELRRVFGAYPTGVAALAALADGAPTGLAANSFTSVSLDPPLVSVCIATTSQTWPLLRTAARIGVSVLSHRQEEASRRLATRGADRFAGLSWAATDAGAVLLEDASAWFDCSVEREIRAGDHDIVVLSVHDLGTDPHLPPLVFHGSRYRRLAVEGSDTPGLDAARSEKRAAA